MKALTHHGSKDMRVRTVADRSIVEDDGILLGVTATALCGSDLLQAERLELRQSIREGALQP